MDKTVNLKQETKFINQYIKLRNKYVDELLSTKVSLTETLCWLKKTNIEIWGIIDQEILTGTILIYLEKQGEVTFFVNKPGQGLGGKLLKLADEIANKHNLESLWAWTKKDNIVAQKAFIKNGYKIKDNKSRKYLNNNIPGYTFLKNF